MSAQDQLSDVLMIEGDEVKPRRDWKSAFDQVFGTAPKAPVLMSYETYCVCCNELGKTPMSKEDWQFITGQT